MKEIDFRDTRLGEVALHTTIISGCFARKKYYVRPGTNEEILSENVLPE